MVGEGCPDQKKSWPISTYFHPHSKKINFHVAIRPAVRDLEKSRVYKRKKKKKKSGLKLQKKNPLFFALIFHVYIPTLLFDHCRAFPVPHRHHQDLT